MLHSERFSDWISNVAVCFVSKFYINLWPIKYGQSKHIYLCLKSELWTNRQGAAEKHLYFFLIKRVIKIVIANFSNSLWIKIWCWSKSHIPTVSSLNNQNNNGHLGIPSIRKNYYHSLNAYLDYVWWLMILYFDKFFRGKKKKIIIQQKWLNSRSCYIHSSHSYHI